jgi:tetratricopeptide (TPR) repeat protein
MTFKFPCPHCGQRVEANDELVGESVVCPTCSQGFVVYSPAQLPPVLLTSGASSNLPVGSRSHSHYWAIFGTVFVLLISGGIFFWSHKKPPQTDLHSDHGSNQTDEDQSLLPTDLFVKVIDCELKGDNDQVISLCSDYLQKNPKCVQAFFNRAVAKESRKDFDGAIADYTRIIALSPKDPKYYSMRAFVRGNKGDMDGAIKDFSTAIELSPNNADLYFSRGLGKGKNGDHKGALSDFTRAIELDPTMAKAYNYRSVARRATGDLAGAEMDSKRVNQLNQK